MALRETSQIRSNTVTAATCAAGATLRLSICRICLVLKGELACTNTANAILSVRGNGEHVQKGAVAALREDTRIILQPENEYFFSFLFFPLFTLHPKKKRKKKIHVCG